jgi:hypothetical protein
MAIHLVEKNRLLSEKHNSLVIPTKDLTMKPYLNTILFLIVTVVSIPAQKQPDFGIYAGGIDPFDLDRVLSLFDFKDIDCQNVDNNYLYTHEIDYTKSEETDTLRFVINVPELHIKELSFSREGNTYLSVDSFTMSDSAKWKECGNGDSLALRDSLLHFKLNPPNHAGAFLLFLNEVQIFNRGDTIQFLLSEQYSSVNIRTISPVNRYTSVNSHSQNKKILQIAKKFNLLKSLEPIQQPTFDLLGRKYMTISGVPDIVLPASLIIRK